MRLRRIGFTMLVVAAGVGACAATPPPVAPRNGGEHTSETSTAQDSGNPAALAIKTLSEHLSVPMTEVRLVSVTPIEWRDSSLGCPKPDRGYLQVIIPGHKAVLEHAGREYNVHVAGKRALVCEPVTGGKGEKIVPIQPLKLLSMEQAQEFAKADLARRLGVAADEITLASSKRVDWDDTSIGCPKLSEDYTIQRSKGYVVDLKYRGRVFTYHSDLRRVFPCPDIDRS